MLVVESHKRTQVQNNKVNALSLFKLVVGNVHMVLLEKQTGQDMVVFLSLYRRKYKMYKDLWERKLRGLNEDEESTVLPKIQV